MLGGKPKWLPLNFGFNDVMRTAPNILAKIWIESHCRYDIIFGGIPQSTFLTVHGKIYEKNTPTDLVVQNDNMDKARVVLVQLLDHLGDHVMCDLRKLLEVQVDLPSLSLGSGSDGQSRLGRRPGNSIARSRHF